MRQRVSAAGVAGFAKPAMLLGGFEKHLRDAYSMEEEPYDVTRFYFDTGVFQCIARSAVFANLTLAMIFINAVYLGIDGDFNKAPDFNSYAIEFQICEHVFCIFFGIEVLIRFCAFAKKRDCISDFWFVFDALLVAYMVTDTYILAQLVDTSTGAVGSFRLLRMFRVARFSRLMRASPELVTMSKAMLAGARAAGSAVLMLLLLIYVFSIALHSLLKDEAEVQEYFSDITNCMWTLLLEGLFMDNIGGLFRA